MRGDLFGVAVSLLAFAGGLLLLVNAVASDLRNCAQREWALDCYMVILGFDVPPLDR